MHAGYSATVVALSVRLFTFDSASNLLAQGTVPCGDMGDGPIWPAWLHLTGRPSGQLLCMVSPPLSLFLSS